MTTVIYSNGSQECQRISMLLQTLQGEYLEYTLNRDFKMNHFVAEFGSDAEFPQVAIGGSHIGGLKETLQYFKRNGVIK